VAWAESLLTAGERDLWRRMAVADRRHSIVVARRFADRRPEATREELAGALLHDVGKIEAGLGTFARVLATIVGPRTRRFRAYHDHERLGADVLDRSGSAPETVALVRGDGPAAPALRAADDV
jgi:Flp pilus assembly protein TadB